MRVTDSDLIFYRICDFWKLNNAVLKKTVVLISVFIEAH